MLSPRLSDSESDLARLESDAGTTATCDPGYRILDASRRATRRLQESRRRPLCASTPVPNQFASHVPCFRAAVCHRHRRTKKHHKQNQYSLAHHAHARALSSVAERPTALLPGGTRSWLKPRRQYGHVDVELPISLRKARRGTILCLSSSSAPQRCE